MAGSTLEPIQSSDLNKKYLRLEHTRLVITTQTFMLLRSTFSTGVPVLFLRGLCLDFPSNTVQPTVRFPHGNYELSEDSIRQGNGGS